MEDIKLYDNILIMSETNVYLSHGSNDQKSATPAGDGMEWIEWNKPLPDDIDEKEYTLEELEK